MNGEIIWDMQLATYNPNMIWTNQMDLVVNLMDVNQPNLFSF